MESGKDELFETEDTQNPDSEPEFVTLKQIEKSADEEKNGRGRSSRKKLFWGKLVAIRERTHSEGEDLTRTELCKNKRKRDSNESIHNFLSPKSTKIDNKMMKSPVNKEGKDDLGNQTRKEGLEEGKEQ